jgi:opacity protein-like surface antigen
MVSPQAAAHYSKKKHVHDVHYVGTKHKHKYKHKLSKVPTRAIATPAYVAPVADNSALQSQIDSLNADVNRLKAQPAPVVAPVKEDTKDNMVFFRGGYGHSNNDRNGVSINNTALGLPAQKADKDAWYFGAGFDFSVDDNLFGLAPNTEVLAELMFDYKEFGTVKGSGPGLLVNNRTVTVNQFTLAASPKIKFLKGQDFRPWIQPVGFALQVVSPPTESITVLQPAMMFGVGADYRVWKNIYVGADARYHQALGGKLDGVNTNGFTAGGYLGLGF